MDLDAFERARATDWARLDELVRLRRRTGAEADELVRLYQSVATDLSSVRSAAPDPEMVTRLSMLVGRARAAIAGTHEPSWRDVTAFVVVALPAALYRIRWWTVGVTVAFLVLGVTAGVWVATQPDALASMGTPSQQQEYVENSFAEYYTPGAGFATMVWTNNAFLTAVCIATGITGIGPVYFLANNAISVGAAGGMMAAHGHLDVFLQLIAPARPARADRGVRRRRRGPADLLDLDRPGPPHARHGARAGGPRAVHRGDRAGGRARGLRA